MQRIITALLFYLIQATFRRVILAEKTSLSSQYFYDLQKFVVIERGLVLLPVASPVEAGKILAQMVTIVSFLMNLQKFKQVQSVSRKRVWNNKILYSSRGFINVFSQRALGFHRAVKFDLNFFVRKTFNYMYM